MIRVTRETHDTPLYVQEACLRAGGLNPYGEPNYRVVWGWNRLDWSGGRWTDCDAHGNQVREVIELRKIPKYLPIERWHLERWTPPESGREAWYKNTIVEVEKGIFVPTLGPYPSRGSYEHCWTLQSPKGEFIQLNPTVVSYFIAAIELSRTFSDQETHQALLREKDREEKEYDSFADTVLNDDPAFDKHPFVTVPELSA